MCVAWVLISMHGIAKEEQLLERKSGGVDVYSGGTVFFNFPRL